MRVATILAGLAALTAYLLPGLAAPGAHWPLWDVHVYWWGGRQAALGGGALYAPGARYSFTYPPFAAALFNIAAHAPEGCLAAVITAASIGALTVLCARSLSTAGIRRRPETVFAVMALALLTRPVAYTLHLGEVNLILAALAGTDLLRRRDGHWWQGIATGLAAGIKLTPLIFVVYLLITRRVRAAATAAGTFAVTVVISFVLLPSRSRVFWLDGVFYNQQRIGDPANLSDQSLSGAVARLAGSLEPAWWWWAIAALLVGLAGITIAAWAHRRGHQLAGISCCAITGLLISPFTWT
ncbi:MAG: glycosyltransferase family 87 protein, partial [Streptosporangiaceae bacterium]